MGAVYFSIDLYLVHMLRRVLPLELFFETGTFQGDTIALAEQFFPRVFSVEKSLTLYEKAKRRFAAKPNVVLAQGDSPCALRAWRVEFRKGVHCFSSMRTSATCRKSQWMVTNALCSRRSTRLAT